MRRAQREFVERYTANVLASGPNADEKDLLERVGRELGWTRSHCPMTREGIIKFAKALMQKPDVLAAIRDRIEFTTGMSLVEADEWLVKHIRGQIVVEETKHFSTPTGIETVKVKTKLPPSLQALAMYRRSTEPVPAKNVNIKQQTLVAKVNIGDDPPEIKVRTIEQ